jgi:hypothetical protein
MAKALRTNYLYKLTGSWYCQRHAPPRPKHEHAGPMLRAGG